MKEEEIKSLYTDFAPKYDKYALNKGKYIVHKELGGELASKLRRNSKVLDLGCGTGLSSTELFKIDCEVTGIDLSKEMLEEAKKLPFKRLICQNIEEPLNVKEDYFDGVIMLGTTEFVQKPELLFKEINKKLKKDGLLAVTFPKKNKRIEGDSKRYSKSEVEKLISKTGFEVVSSREVFGYVRRDGEEEVIYYCYILKKL